MEANKCPNCGASINNETDRITTCKYCGGTIINEAATVEKPEPQKTQQPSSFYTNINPETQHPIHKIKLKFNGLIFLMLLIFMWPLAFLYLFICKAEEKENKNKK